MNNPKGAAEWPLWLLSVLLIVPVAMFACSPEKNAEFSSSGALALCQVALKQASRDPDKADIPYVEDFGSGGEFYFAWGPQTKVVRMRNGVGLDVAANAACIVDKAGRKIKALSLNGQTII